MHENRIRVGLFLVTHPKRELEYKELAAKGNDRLLPSNWNSEMAPRSFIDLISDGHTNRVFMKWLSQWKPTLFHVHHLSPSHL